MGEATGGGYLVLLVGLTPDPDGEWQVVVEDGVEESRFKLMPLQLVARLWRSGDGRWLRGELQLGGSSVWVPIQSGGQIEGVLRSWLGGESAGERGG